MAPLSSASQPADTLPNSSQRRQPRRDDPFAALVRRLHDDPGNAYNLDRYLWVLEEPPAQPCGWCRTLFDPWFGYDAEPARGHRRRHCSTGCRNRAAWARRRGRLPLEWKRAA